MRPRTPNAAKYDCFFRRVAGRTDELQIHCFVYRQQIPYLKRHQKKTSRKRKFSSINPKKVP
jgi:hypothetical protein